MSDKTQLIQKLIIAQSGACNCLTKTPEVSWHETSCRYRVLAEAADELRAVLAQEAGKVEPEGQREKFQKWVLATKHPALGFLDGHWLERGDDREGYANEYVQGLWVAFKEFASPPAPVAAVLPERLQEILTFLDGSGTLDGWSFGSDHSSGRKFWWRTELRACLDKVKELNDGQV
jgi:hypothetical protein